jgi:hypothetical protein
MTASHWRIAVGSVEYRIWKYICQLWNRQPHWDANVERGRFSVQTTLYEQFSMTTLVILSAPGGLAAFNYKLQYLGMFFLSFS